MEIIPCISLKKGNIWVDDENHQLSIDELKAFIEAEKKLYVIDYDGIDKNQPNLTLLQELADEFTLWADTGPRNLEDVVDTIMAGATLITLDDTIWTDIDLPAVKEVTEDEVYVGVDFTKDSVEKINPAVFYGVDGIIVLNTKEEIEPNFTAGSMIKNLAVTHKLYAFESDPDNKAFWQEKGISGLFVDIDCIKEF